MLAQGKLCVPGLPQSPALGIHRHTPTATRDASFRTGAGPQNLGWTGFPELLRHAPNSLKGTQVEGLRDIPASHIPKPTFFHKGELMRGRDGTLTV